METINRSRHEPPKVSGWHYGRHKNFVDTHPVEPQRVLRFANGLAVPNGGGFTPMEDFDWFGSVPTCEPV